MSGRQARHVRERVPRLSLVALVLPLPQGPPVALPQSFCEDRLLVREQVESPTPARSQVQQLGPVR